MLSELGTEYVDLVLVHWPGAAKTPPGSEANAELRLQTWRVLEDFYRRGKFRAIGVSNYEVEHLSELLSVAAVPPAVNQFECHPRRPAHALRAACAAAGVAAVAYASLGCGQLLREPTVAAAADAAGVPPAALLLRWGLEQGCAVIPKSVDPRRVRAFAEPALLSSDVWGRREAADALSRLEALDDGHKFCWDPQGIR
uniref:NADP-dependent oxidoreductase domain-containing protein n=1 Tax=Chlamydomonas euryale TaxID=1486919 RepID=A0A7R9YZL3_9CHLO|mmetsp:Transcript_35795/g.105826  ORF Transcript_35795/g.105826 Transcript_35795/m.105826 type:complete len:198 (+) Transcript_35795:522-1115(+)